MKGYLRETMLQHYFLADAAIGRFLEDRRPLFEAFANIFLLPAEERDTLYALVSDSRIADMSSEAAYMRFCRVRDYYKLTSAKRGKDPTEPFTDIKGDVLRMAVRYEFSTNEGVCSIACSNLFTVAEKGVVPFLTVLGVLLSEGIVVGRDEARGVSFLRCAAAWNSVGGLFAALRYDTENRARHLSALHALLLRNVHKRTAARVEEAYGQAAPADSAVLLLEKAFAQSIVQRDIYSKTHARLLYSTAVGEKDKEAVLLSRDASLVAEAGGLPLKLDGTRHDLDTAELSAARPLDERETREISARLANSDLCRTDGYRPLCFLSDSTYMTERYISTIERAFRGANLRRIELGDLIGYDLEPTGQNIFVRECVEDRPNVYLIFFRGEIPSAVFEAAKNFLIARKRRRFRLIRPCLSLDLSPILPVCFADGMWEERLKELCDIVRLHPLSQEERSLLPAEIVREKQALYGAEGFSVPESSLAVLAGFSADDTERIVDAAVREHRYTPYALTEEDIDRYERLLCPQRSSLYGFGGRIHE